MRDRPQALVERLDLLGRLGVDPAQRRLAEVGQVRAREAADEALGARRSRSRRRRPRATWCERVEHDRRRPPRARRRTRPARSTCQSWLPSTVITGISRSRTASARSRLLGLAVRGQVAGEQDQVDAPRERARTPSRARSRSRRAAEVDVAGGGDPDPALLRRSRRPSVAWSSLSSYPSWPGSHLTWPRDEQPFADIEHALKRAAAALREADVPFLLGGSLASWARGGPETRHDLDLMIKPEDVERALEALAEAGMRPEEPPEDWLVKAWDGDTLVDLIYSPKGLPVDDEVIARGEEISVLGMEIRVMALEDVMVTKLMALSEHSLRYEWLLPIARALREQVDWDDVRARTAESPFARRSSCMLEGLGILPEAKPTTGGHETRVRVLTPRGSAAAHVG